MSVPSQELVPYRAWSPPVPSSDLTTRLSFIAITAAESVLRRRIHQDGRSLLDHLQSPENGIASYQAACNVLETLALQTEQAAWDSAMAFRYIQSRGLWQGHPNPAVDSAMALIRTMTCADLVEANIVIGASTQVTKRNCIRFIADIWGDDWFDHVRTAFPACEWEHPNDCSRGILTEMAANAKQDYSLAHALASWQEACRLRNDFGSRRRLGIRAKTTPKLVRADVAWLNRPIRAEDTGRRPTEMFLAEDVEEDWLRVTQTSAETRDIAPTSKPAKKRRKTQAGGSTAAASGSKGQHPMRIGSRASTRGRNGRADVIPPSAQPHRETLCSGSILATLLESFRAQVRGEWDVERAAQSCCESCEDAASEGLDVLDLAEEIAQRLKGVENHIMDGNPVLINTLPDSACAVA